VAVLTNDDVGEGREGYIEETAGIAVRLTYSLEIDEE
jgi:hypothetical protein